MADTSAPTVNGGNLVETTKSNAAAAYDSLANGPVAQSTMDHAVKASAEFTNLANARKTPSNPAATGQPLTHYHSFFSELLAWTNPRASAIAYATIVSFIFAVRYLDLIRYAFKVSWMVLGATVAAEAAGKLLMNTGLTTQVRPRKYYTVSRDTLDAMIGDVHELVNFFVIESQRILFAENVSASFAAFIASFVSYFLVKIVPYWGLAIIGTTLAFFVPLIYTSNQELIDTHLKNASEILNSQTAQMRSVASKHTSQVAGLTKQYVGDYSAKAQQMIRGQSAEPEASSKPAGREVLESDFPEAPKGDPVKEVKEPIAKEEEPVVKVEEPLHQEPINKEDEPLLNKEEPTPAM